jgi:hypothetical protein
VPSGHKICASIVSVRCVYGDLALLYSVGIVGPEENRSPVWRIADVAILPN